MRIMREMDFAIQQNRGSGRSDVLLRNASQRDASQPKHRAFIVHTSEDIFERIMNRNGEAAPREEQHRNGKGVSLWEMNGGGGNASAAGGVVIRKWNRQCMGAVGGGGGTRAREHVAQGTNE
jgi:hypothetical protein